MNSDLQSRLWISAAIIPPKNVWNFRANISNVFLIHILSAEFKNRSWKDSMPLSFCLDSAGVTNMFELRWDEFSGKGGIFWIRIHTNISFICDSILLFFNSSPLKRNHFQYNAYSSWKYIYVCWIYSYKLKPVKTVPVYNGMLS